MTEAFNAALRLLSRREHGAQELIKKLTRKGYNDTEIAQAVSKCQDLDLQSDARFTESLCRVRIRQGNGPLKISQELQAKQISSELIDRVLHSEQNIWFTQALMVWQKKFKNSKNLSYTEIQKGQRFLFYRGFPTEIIAEVVAKVNSEFRTLS